MSVAGREGYAFHAGTGAQVRLSNARRTAERLLAGMEFQNGVVMCDRPLEDGKPFQVVIDKKVSTWSGSVIIGATTTPPERFTFPPNLSCLTSNCWVVNGKSLWKNGCRKEPSYVPQVLEALSEGNSVGVVKRGCCLHFLVNGSELAAAEETLPPDSKVWGLVDLYGQCSRVSVVQLENRQSSSSSSLGTVAAPLLFHVKCGKHGQVLGGGTTVCRKSPPTQYDNCVAISNRALNSDELFEVEILDVYPLWSGSIELGVTTHNPEQFEFPSTLTNVTSGTWVMSGCSVMCNGFTVIQDYGTSFDSLKTGDRVGVMRQSSGSLVYFVNGRELGVAATNLPPLVYAVVDVYGQCSKVRLTSSSLPQEPGGTSTTEVEPEIREVSRASGENTMSRNEGGLKFNPVCGENAKVHDGGRVASREKPFEEYTSATVLTSRTLKPGEMFEVRIDEMIESWSGSLQMGVCQVDPQLLDFEEIEELTDLCLPSWILSGSDLYIEGMSSDTDYPLDLDALPQDSKISIKVTSDGDLHFFVNRVDMGVAASGLPTEGLYGCLEVYGSCTQVSLIDHDDNVAITQNHVTSESVPEEYGPSTSGNADVCEELQSVSHTALRHQFHPVHGRHVCLSKDRTVAKRLQGFDNGLLFSHRPLQPGEVFEVELTELSMRVWQGSVRAGLVSKLPKSLPSSISQLEGGSWSVVGSSIICNGSTIRQDFVVGQQFQLKVGSRLAVWYEDDGWMHIAVDGTDLGPLLPQVTKLPYAVVDLYGGAHSVRVVNTPLEERGASTSSDNSMLWSAECGSHIQLSRDYRVATRTKSYSYGVVFSSNPLPDDHLFQCVIKEVDRSNWDGTFSVGVTSISPHNACHVEKAQELKRRSFVICTQAKVTRLYVGGKEVCKLPEVSLSSVQEGGTIGILCKSCDKTLHFYIDHTHLEVKLPEGNVRLPSTRYTVVDLYGQCRSIELRPLADLSEVPDAAAAADVSISLVKEDLTHVKRHKHRHRQQQISHNHQQHQENGHSEHPSSQQIPPDQIQSTSRVEEEERNGVARKPDSSGAVMSVPPVDRGHITMSSYQDCNYYQLCKAFLNHLMLPVEYLSPNVEHSKCYCHSCFWGESDVKFSGDPPEKYSVPVEWVKFGLRLTFGPQAEQHKSFDTWHKAYHGTSPGLVRRILDHGGLLLPGSCLLGGSERVVQPPGHYTNNWKPKNFDTEQIFVTPSIKYCAFKDVYTKKHRFQHEGQTVEGRVCFKLLIDPQSYSVSPRTITTQPGEVIDRNFSDEELEWSTKVDRSVYLYGLMIRVDKLHPP